MQIVFVLEVSVEEWLTAAGRVEMPRPSSCPSCGYGRVNFDGSYPRYTRRGRVSIQRLLCMGCERSHSLLPDVLVTGRVDLVSVIGWALEAKAAGWGYRRIAVELGELGVSPSTVRRWLRRAAGCAGRIANRLLGVAAAAGASQRAPPWGDGPIVTLVAAVQAAAAGWSGLSDEPVDAWRFAVRHTGGQLLG